jgi:hypothetical protein
VKRKDPCFPVSPLSQARQRNADRDGRPPRLIASAPSRLAPAAARPRVRLPPHQGRILHLPAHPHRYGRRPRSLFLDRLGQQALASDSHRLLLWQAVLAGTALRPRPSTPASSPRPGPRCTAAASAAGRASRYSTLVSINQETEHAFPAVCFPDSNGSIPERRSGARTRSSAPRRARGWSSRTASGPTAPTSCSAARLSRPWRALAWRRSSPSCEQSTSSTRGTNQTAN